MSNGNAADITTADSSAFKYKSIFFRPLTADDNGVFKDVKIAVQLKHLTKFWRSLKIPLINCKSYLQLNWSKDCVMSAIADTTSKITNTMLHIPILTLSSKDKVKLIKLLVEVFKRPVYWNKYQTRIETRDSDNNNLTRFPLDANFLLLIILKHYLVKLYDEIRKTSTGQGDDYTTGCLLDYRYFKDHYNLLAVDLSKQKQINADSRAVQQIAFYGM